MTQVELSSVAKSPESFSISLIRVEKTSTTRGVRREFIHNIDVLMCLFCFAEHSINGHFHFEANSSPSSTDTCLQELELEFFSSFLFDNTNLAFCKSDILPTNTLGGSVPSILSNFSLMSLSFSNETRELME